MSLRARGGVLALSLLAVACSGGLTRQLDTDRLETVLRERLTGQGVTANVDCPDDVPLQQGHVSSCTLTFPDGSTQSVSVTQTDGEGNVRFE